MGRCFHVQDYGPPPRQSRRYRGENDRWFCRVPRTGIIRELGGAMIEYGDGLPDSDDEDFGEALRIKSEQLSAELAKHLANITPRDAGLEEDSTEDEDVGTEEEDDDVGGLQQDNVVGGYTWIEKDGVAYLTKQKGHLEEEHIEEENIEKEHIEEEDDELRSSDLRKYQKQSFAPLSPHSSP